VRTGQCRRAAAPARLGVPDVAHRHGVDADAVAPEFARQHAAHLHHAARGATDEGLAHRGHAPGIGADGHDLAVALRAHHRRRGLDGVRARQPVRTDVGLEVGAFHLHEQLEGQRVAAGAGAAGHQHVEPAVALHGAPDHRLHRLAVRQIGGFEFGAATGGVDLVDHGLAAVGVAAVDDHQGAALRQFLRHGAADVGRGAGD